MGDRIRIPGGRDVQATLDGSDSECGVVACPPHPQMGGDRTDARLRAVSDALAERDVDFLRIDYGPWDEGRAEQTDVRNALEWCRDRYRTVGLFGYSFGGSMALLAAASAFEDDDESWPDAVSVLAPASTVEGLDAATAVDGIACPLQIVYGERDDTVDSVPVAERAGQGGKAVERLQADHFYVGQQARAGDLVATFLAEFLTRK